MTSDYQPGGTPEEPPSGANVALFAVVGFVSYLAVGCISLSIGQPWLIVVLVVASVILAIKRTWRGFGLGVAIGCGLTLLAVGLCFATFKIGG